ncbi:hypothetical protein [Nocardia brasiliensis]|uniref:hypothetical protein n=1 Tax=Nocardia brasiliensis TaxID=37326 RepID=UPI00114CC9CE|nr:hypothetical protein [Nocardia brasiliensis]
MLTASISPRTESRRQLALERQQMREAQRQQDGQLHEPRLEHLPWRRALAYLDLLTDLSSADRANQQLFRELVARSAPAPVVDEARLGEIRRGLFKAAEHTADKVVLERPRRRCGHRLGRDSSAWCSRQ